MPTKIQPEESDEKRWCTMCGNQKPLSEFHRDLSSPDGYKRTCKECRAAIHAEQQESKTDPRLQAIEEEGLSALETLSRGGSFLPNTSELVESILRPFGGADGFAKVLYATFFHNKPTSMQRVQLLKMIMELIRINSAKGGAEEVLENLSEADLHRVLTECVKRSPELARLTSSQATLDVIPRNRAVKASDT